MCAWPRPLTWWMMSSSLLHPARTSQTQDCRTGFTSSTGGFSVPKTPVASVCPVVACVWLIGCFFPLFSKGFGAFGPLDVHIRNISTNPPSITNIPRPPASPAAPCLFGVLVCVLAPPPLYWAHFLVMTIKGKPKSEPAAERTHSQPTLNHNQNSTREGCPSMLKPCDI